MNDGIGQGRSFPLGATITRRGVNFSVFSRSAAAIEILLFDRADAASPSRVIPLHPVRNRTYHYWHAFVPGLRAGQIYAYRASGPFEPGRGLRFDPEKTLLDPYGRAVAVPPGYSRVAACRPGDNTAVAMKSVITNFQGYDWEGDMPLRRPFAQTVIYEMHVRGFTAHASSGVAPEKRGTYAGLIEKIPYLQDLGITAVELLPVFQFDAQDAPPGLVNYWGYTPVSFFAPHVGYGTSRDPLDVIDEFRDMVKALHRAGIEVILDVVFNHTSENDQNGPTFCFRGLDNPTYYLLGRDRTYYADYSGTGNTLNANQTVVRRLILDSIRHWVEHMHVDGFRFDLAAILSRDENGVPLQNPPLLLDIESDPVLAGTKLIAEAWDAAGLYQVGRFVGDNWQEWNGKFRDDVRAFMKGDPDTVSRAATRFLASPDMFGREERGPEQSVNFVTCHDGFTLNDLVTYNEKHNETNGEGNRDGNQHNLSWNCGVEGPTDDPEIEGLRNRQVKNFLAITLISLGTPMIAMGDEVRRTQRGNNNAWCQDNEISWLDWTLLDRHADVHRFAKLLIAGRKLRELARLDLGMSLNELLRRANVEWHGVRLGQPDWGPGSHSLAFCARSLTGRVVFHGMMNAWWKPLTFELPPPASHSPDGWRRGMDTSLGPPDDARAAGEAPPVEGSSYVVQPRSIVVLFSVRAGPAPVYSEIRALP